MNHYNIKKDSKRDELNNMKKNIIATIILILLTGTVLHGAGTTNEINSDSFKTELEEIRDAIIDAEAKWIAEYTSISNSSYWRNEGCCNNIIEDMDDITLDDVYDMSYFSSLPDMFDWRNVEGTDWTTTIKNQGSCGSCSAFAAVAALESVIQIEIGHTFECDLSEAFLLLCGGGNCGTGIRRSDAADFISSVGVVDELCLPYNPYSPWLMDCDDKEPNWKNRTVSARHLKLNTNLNVKYALVEYGPIMTALSVYSDFFYYRGGIYEQVSNEYAGRHAITIVGYNDIEGYWICKNSWGELWGEENPYDEKSNGGWFRIKYGESSLGIGGFYAFYDYSGNLHPYKPTDLSPIDGENDVEPNGLLRWSCEDPDGDELLYTIYLSRGTVSPTEEYVIAERISTNSYSLDNLDIKKARSYSWIVLAEDEHESKSMSDMLSFTTRKLYEPYLYGPSRIKIGEEYTFTASTTETDDDEYYWFFNWGDGSNSGWIGPYGPNDEVSQSHIWNGRGEYIIRVKYKVDGVHSDFTTLRLPVQKTGSINIWFFYLFEEYPQLFSLLHQLFDLNVHQTIR